MRIKVVAFSMFLGLALGIALPAAKAPARPFFVPQQVTLDGAEIPSGMYQLTLEEDKSGVQVKLWKDGRFIASGRGVWVRNGVKYKDNAVLLRVNPDGSRSLIEIRLAGGAKTIVLQGHDMTVQYSAK